MTYSPTQTVELFHLLFLRYLGEKLDKKLYALKGGCNLRFFFKSIRYSQDLDIDIKVTAKETLRNKVQKILEAPSFQQTLSAKGIQINQWSAPKQTETTQRWKIALTTEGHTLPLPTQVEFSRRKMTESVQFEPVDPEIPLAYQLYPILMNHYTKEAAFVQKLDALAHRQETQARDIFDLKLLIDAGAKFPSRFQPDKKTIRQTLENASSLNFKDFKGQVLAFLSPQYQDYFDSEKVWQDIVSKVLETLESFKS